MHKRSTSLRRKHLLLSCLSCSEWALRTQEMPRHAVYLPPRRAAHLGCGGEAQGCHLALFRTLLLGNGGHLGTQTCRQESSDRGASIYLVLRTANLRTPNHPAASQEPRRCPCSVGFIVNTSWHSPEISSFPRVNTGEVWLSKILVRA